MNLASMTIGKLRGRRGLVALGFAVAIMILMFTTTSAFTLALMAGGARSEHAIRQMQAVQAAQAGVDVALQAGTTQGMTGECGRARYAVVRRGGVVAALGQVSGPAGAPVRSLIEVRASGRGMVRGSWREPAPATRPDLAAMLEGPVDREDD